MVPFQDKPFPVRSVPESLRQAAKESMIHLREKGVNESDIMEA